MRFKFQVIVGELVHEAEGDNVRKVILRALKSATDDACEYLSGAPGRTIGFAGSCADPKDEGKLAYAMRVVARDLKLAFPNSTVEGGRLQ